MSGLNPPIIYPSYRRFKIRPKAEEDFTGAAIGGLVFMGVLAAMAVGVHIQGKKFEARYGR